MARKMDAAVRPYPSVTIQSGDDLIRDEFPAPRLRPHHQCGDVTECENHGADHGRDWIIETSGRREVVHDGRDKAAPDRTFRPPWRAPRDANAVQWVA
jgi:hypothetical protein